MGSMTITERSDSLFGQSSALSQLNIFVLRESVEQDFESLKAELVQVFGNSL